MKRVYKVVSDNVKYGEEFIESKYSYPTTRVNKNEKGEYILEPKEDKYVFRTQSKIPKLGVLIVGIGGNNGTTLLGGMLANKHKLQWEDNHGVHTPDYFGSMTQSATLQIGFEGEHGVGKEVWAVVKDLVPMVDPNDIVLGGWDINSDDYVTCTKRNQVLAFDLQQKLKPYFEKMGKPMPGVYYADFIAENQRPRADHILDPKKTKKEHLEIVRKNIRDFKTENKLDKVIVLWSANTERYSEIKAGIHDTAENMMKAIEKNEAEIAPSAIYCIASILEGCSYINGSPQNTFVPGIVEMSKEKKVYIAGNDFKSGQTKIKSVLADFLVGAGIKPESIVSYNHLGNNDGLNLNSFKQFRSKEISKKGVVDDVVESNEVLFPEGAKHPDHVVVIKYVPFVGDSKRAMDEYTSRIFLGGLNTIILHNTCEDSLLAAPLILDLIIMTELCERITWKKEEDKDFNKLHHILSILGYWLKAPFTPEDTPCVNALFRQRHCVENFLRALLGIPANANLLLEQKLVN